MSVSANLIAEFEGYRDNPYWDVNAYRAGFGSDTTTLADGRVVPIQKGMTVSREDSIRDLDRRISQEFQPSAMRAVGDDVWNALAPEQQAVLASLAYNYGAGSWGKDLRGVTSAVKTPGFEDDIAAIRALASHNDGINSKRRNREADIYAGIGGVGAGPGGQADGYAGGSPQEAYQHDPARLAWAYEQQGNALAGPQQAPQQEFAMAAPQLRANPINALYAPVAGFSGGWFGGNNG